MNTANKYVIDERTVAREADIGGGMTNSELKSGPDFIVHLAKRVPFETGLMPRGVISYRQAGDHAQIVLEVIPGNNQIIWGAHEGSSNAETFELAQPWQYVVGDLQGDNLLGARLFYSPEQIVSEDQQLYLANLPNLNLRGYGQAPGNGIGWICLYRRQSWTSLTLGEKIIQLGMRASGNEAYNDGNMSETDGPRFYKSMGKPNYTWDPKAWEKKSQAEGHKWTLDKSLWVPALVGGIDDQTKYKANGVPLTLGMAMYGHTACYYGDKYKKPINKIHRKEPFDKASWADLCAKMYATAFNSSRKVEAPKSDKSVCPSCKLEVDKLTTSVVGLGTADGVGKVCAACAKEKFFVCTACKKRKPIETKKDKSCAACAV